VLFSCIKYLFKRSRCRIKVAQLPDHFGVDSIAIRSTARSFAISTRLASTYSVWLKI
jgi:hypothetical protein